MRLPRSISLACLVISKSSLVSWPHSFIVKCVLRGQVTVFTHHVCLVSGLSDACFERSIPPWLSWRFRWAFVCVVCCSNWLSKQLSKLHFSFRVIEKRWIDENTNEVDRAWRCKQVVDTDCISIMCCHCYFVCLQKQCVDDLIDTGLRE